MEKKGWREREKADRRRNNGGRETAHRTERMVGKRED